MILKEEFRISLLSSQSDSDLEEPEADLTISKLTIHRFLYSKLNILLLFSPLGFYAFLTSMAPTTVFTYNFLALIPLANILGESTEELADAL